jgi:endonuclease/exonuclease/phosphatase family metal-dependent hydrolase
VSANVAPTGSEPGADSKVVVKPGALPHDGPVLEFHPEPTSARRSVLVHKIGEPLLPAAVAFAAALMVGRTTHHTVLGSLIGAAAAVGVAYLGIHHEFANGVASSPVPARSDAGAAKGQLRVVTVNVKSMQGTTWNAEPYSTPYDPTVERKIASFIRKTNPDVVLLQEVNDDNRRSRGQDQVAQLAADVGAGAPDQHEFFPAIRDQGGTYGDGMIVRNGVHFAHRKDGSNDADRFLLPQGTPNQERREAGVGHLVLPDGRPFTAIVTHLGLSQYERGLQLTRLSAIAQAQHRPVIVGGDFNETPDNVDPYMQRAGLASAWQAAGIGNWSYQRWGHPTDGPIDGLYVSGGTAVRRILLNDMGYVGFERRASDHAATVADVTIGDGSATK